MKICNTCFIDKDFREFYIDKTKTGELMHVCKECWKQKARIWAKNNRKQINSHRRKNYNSLDEKKRTLLRVHNITLEQYEELHKNQNGRCAICGLEQHRKLKNRDLYIDHDHITNKIRGLLCFDCNIMLGHAQDNPEILIKAIQYLKLSLKLEV